MIISCSGRRKHSWQRSGGRWRWTEAHAAFQRTSSSPHPPTKTHTYSYGWLAFGCVAVTRQLRLKKWVTQGFCPIFFFGSIFSLSLSSVTRAPTSFCLTAQWILVSPVCLSSSLSLSILDQRLTPRCLGPLRRAERLLTLASELKVVHWQRVVSWCLCAGSLQSCHTLMICNAFNPLLWLCGGGGVETELSAL